MATSALSNSVKTPGVYVEEIPKLPPSIAQVETAIPAFIGYTQTAKIGERDLTMVPYRIQSMLEYELYFGLPAEETGIVVRIAEGTRGLEITTSLAREKRSKFNMYYALQLFFANGGGACWIISTGNYAASGGTIVKKDLSDGLQKTEKVDEITLYVFPDAQGLSTAVDYYDLYTEAIVLCTELQDRFTVTDVWHDPNSLRWSEDIDILRNRFPPEVEKLKYAASYFPNLETSLDLYYGRDENVSVEFQGGTMTLTELKSKNNAYYFRALSAIRDLPCLMPPSPAIVGIYARVDAARGVWKSPANVGVSLIDKPEYLITDNEQKTLNVDSAFGKSVNVIRSFTGRGIIVWGARTLAGNDNEWRYVSVRRFFNMVEESTKNATAQFVFEPNDRNTWTRVRSMIENFLRAQWQAGALMGASTEEAFYVHVGLNETMTEVDIWEGKMIVEIGMAVVRPAEFIILQFSHKMLSES